MTLTAAALVTLLDVALLDRKKGVFTGGFLAVDAIETAGLRVLFGVVSVAADAAVTGVLAAVGLWIARRLSLVRTAAATLAFALALGPLVLADLLRYELVRYLGDAMDLSLMFDLAGRRPSEFLAVAGAHLVLPAAGLAVGIVLVATTLFWLNRREAGRLGRLALGGRVGWWPPLALFVVGALILGVARVQSTALDNGLRRKPSGDWVGRFITLVTDFDRDGYGLLGRPADPVPFDARIYPYAVEIPGNGVDENGVGGDLPAAWPAFTEPRGVPPQFVRRPNVVLVVLESFRADVVGAQVDGRPVTPVLDALGARGASSHEAYSHNGYTAQSRFHLLSGSLAGLRGGTTFIDDFKANGYEVAYVSGQDESFGGAAYDVGFDRADFTYDARMSPDRRYSTFTTAGSLAVPLDVVVEQVERFLDQRRSKRPFFLYVNFHDTHFPYHHHGLDTLVSDVRVPRPRIGPERAADLHLMYRNTAANVDAAIGTVLAAVERSVGHPPAVIVTADHGESLFDEGFLGHGYALNDVQTRVPFIVSGLALRMVEPFGQIELRDAVWRALADEDVGDDGVPRFDRDADKVVFQYLGSSVSRPRAIAHLSLQGRIGYDFREARVTVPGGNAVRERDLGEGAQRAFLNLVYFWESVVRARVRPDAVDTEPEGAVQ